MAQAATETATFLFTDIEGSTRLLRQLRRRYAEVLSQHQELLRRACEQAGGREIDTQGDASFFVFSTATDAVLAAAAAQRALHEHQWPEGAELRVRMGIHTGRASVEEARYHGLAVHRAARICAAAHGGQVLLSQTTQNLLEDEEEEEELRALSVRDLGEQRLKDFDRPVPVFQLVVPGLPSEFPPPRAPDTAPFAGREEELADAVETVRRPRWRTRPLLAGVVIVPLVAVAAALALRGGDHPPAVGPNMLVRIDPERNEVTDATPLTGREPVRVAASGEALWVVMERTRGLYRFDPASGEGETVAGLAAPMDIAPDRRGGVWVVNSPGRAAAFAPPGGGGGPATIVRFGPGGTRLATLRLPRDRSAIAIAAAFGSLWVTSVSPTARGFGPETVSRIDPESGRVLKTYTVGASPLALAVGEDAVWVANYDDVKISRIDPVTGDVEHIEVKIGPRLVATAAGSVWVVQYWSPSSLFRVDPLEREVVGELDLPGENYMGLAADRSGVWAVSPEGGVLVRVDPRTGSLVKTFRFREAVPTDVALGHGAVWLTTAAP